MYNPIGGIAATNKPGAIKSIRNFFRFIGLFIKWRIKFLLRIRRIRLLKRANKQLKKTYLRQLRMRKQLRADIDKFLYDYFGIGAISKYIPHDRKNKDRVREAVMGRFGERMEKLNLGYSDLFK